jgi:predicted phosphate transport protein (TIGR00153 family)
MKLNDIFKFFVPQDNSFFPLFEENGKVLLKAAELLKTVMTVESLQERGMIIKQIKDVEHDGDNVTHRIYQQLNKSFITPFDREDIQELASSLDDVIDFINGTAQKIELYKPKVFMPVFLAMAETILEAAKEIESSLQGLQHPGNNREAIIQACINLNTLENRADDLHHSGLSDLFEFEKDTIELIKKKAILETLEKTVDKAEDVSDVIKTILVKLA